MKLSKKRWWGGAIFAGLVIVLALPMWGLRAYFTPSSSGLKVEAAGTTGVVRFGLSDKDKSRLLTWSKKLNLTWSGQDLAIGLDASSSAKLKAWAPLNFGLSTPSDQEVVLSGNVSGLPLGILGSTSEGEEFLPPSTALVLRATGLQNSYQLTGQEVFHYVAARGTLGVIFNDRGLGIIFVTKVKDETALKAQLATLKNLPVNTGPGYSGVEGVAAGFSESSTAGVTTYTLSQPGLAYQPTFGILQGSLVIASSPEVWQLSVQARTSGVNINSNTRYAQAKQAAAVFSNGSLYLDLKAITARGSKITSDTAPLFKLDLASGFLNSGLAGDRLESLSAQWLGLGLSETSPSRLLVRIRHE